MPTTRIFLIGDDQLLELYDCVLDGDLGRFEKTLALVRDTQEIAVTIEGGKALLPVGMLKSSRTEPPVPE
jgi:hypothetical protein